MIIYGLNPVKDFINLFPNKISTLFISKNKLSDSEMKSVVNINTVYVSDAELKRITGTTKHQSLAAEIDMPRPKEFKHFKNDIKNMSNIVLILDHIKDPQNLGQIIRTAECSGINGILLPKHHTAPVTNTVLQVSQGAFVNMNLYEVINLKQTLSRLKEDGFWIIGIENDISAKHWNEIDYTGNIAVLLEVKVEVSEKKLLNLVILSALFLCREI